MSALSSGKIDKFDSFTSEKTLLSDQNRIIGQAKFTYFPLSKTFAKQIKTIKKQGKKQVEGLEVLKPYVQKSKR